MDSPHISSDNNDTNYCPISTNIAKFYAIKVGARQCAIKRAISEICPVIQQILKEIEIQEPRFISSLTLNESTGKYEGLTFIGGELMVGDETESHLKEARFEVNLYLNQMGVFNFVDDGSSPGCSVLKLSDGRKRSMSLWVEFITASGYLSARKIRARFHSLLVEACVKIENLFNHHHHPSSTITKNESLYSMPFYRDETIPEEQEIDDPEDPDRNTYCNQSLTKTTTGNYDQKNLEIQIRHPFDDTHSSTASSAKSDNFLVTKTATPPVAEISWAPSSLYKADADVTIILWEKYSVTIVPAFKCSGMWPRSANTWPFSYKPRYSSSSYQKSSHLHNSECQSCHHQGVYEDEYKSIIWPSSNLVSKAKSEGFTLISREPAQQQIVQVMEPTLAGMGSLDKGANSRDQDPQTRSNELIRNVEEPRNLLLQAQQSKQDTNFTHNNNIKGGKRDNNNILTKKEAILAELSSSLLFNPQNANAISTNDLNTSSSQTFPRNFQHQIIQQQQQHPLSVEGDTWLMIFTEAENVLLRTGCRQFCFRILKTLRDRHLENLPGRPVTPYLLKTLLLFECEKHPYEEAWDWHLPDLSRAQTDIQFDKCGYVIRHDQYPVILDRLIGILLQLIYCLQCRRCPHYFLPAVDLLKDHNWHDLSYAANKCWALLRTIRFNPLNSWETL